MELTSSTGWPWSSVLVLFITFSLSLVLLLRYCRRHHKNKDDLPPPGPPALVMIAKVLALLRGTLDLGTLLRDLEARHGPIISVGVFDTRVFVTDRRVAHAVLVQGGAAFADRPPLDETKRLFTSGTGGVIYSPYGSYWRLLRRNLTAQALSPARVARFGPARRPAQEALVRDLLLSGGAGAAQVVEVRPEFRRALLKLLVHMGLGAWLETEALEEVQELHLRIMRAITGFLPLFSLPLSKSLLFRRRWEGHVAVRRRLEEIFLPLIHARRAAAAAADGRPCSYSYCYADSLLALRVAEEGGRPLTDSEVVSLCTEFFVAGVDTTATALEWIMAELVNRPDVQSKLYQEVKFKEDTGCGDDDLGSMPYLKAVVLEGLRLHPPVHILTPHAVLSDGAAIGGHPVPKGTEVYLVASDFGRDETVWTAAQEFRPERFLEGGEGHDVDLTGSKEIKMMPFGAGRRMCPAYRLGILQLEFFVGSLVRDLEWLPATEGGEQPDMAKDLDFNIVMKHPLRARVVPRSSSTSTAGTAGF